MNKPFTYKNQIIRWSNGEGKIHLTDAPFDGLNRNSSIFAFTFHAIMFTIAGLAIAPTLTLLTASTLFISVYYIAFLFPSNIKITNRIIQDKNNTLILENIPYLDFFIKPKKKGVIVQFADFKFRLKNAEDLPLMLDVIADNGKLEFYENYQLSTGIQVVTYKSKDIVVPVFATLLTIYNTKQGLIFSDTINQNFWIEIPTNITSTNRFIVAGNIPINKKIDINTVQKILLRNHKGRLEILINDVPIFKSSIRRSKYELSNLRDIEKIYSSLKKLDTLKNIEIKK